MPQKNDSFEPPAEPLVRTQANGSGAEDDRASVVIPFFKRDNVLNYAHK